MQQIITAKLKLKTTLEQHQSLRQTQLAYRDALNYVSQYAFAHGKLSNKEFLSAGEAARALGVSVKTIQRWDKAGLLPVIRTATNQRRIPVDAVERIRKTSGPTLRCAIYARVSSAKQENEGNLTCQ